MRIKNKYLRNRAFRNVHWNRIRSISHPFETFCPYWYLGSDSTAGWIGNWHNSTEKQIQNHFDDIALKVRALESGTHKQWVVWRASADFRRLINKQRKARDRHKMAKIRNGDYDVEFEKYHEDACWYYF